LQTQFKRIVLVIQFLLFSIFLASCSDNLSPSQGGGQSQTATNTLNQEFRVALLIPMGSEDTETANLARIFEQSTQMAIDQVSPSPIVLNVYDTKGNPQDAYIAAQQAISDGTDIILGPLYSDSTRVIAPLANVSRIPVFSFSNDSRIASGYVFSLGQTFENASERIVNYLISQGYTRAIIVQADTISEIRGAEVLTQAAQVAGMELIQTITYEYSQPGGLKAVEEIALAIEADKPDVLLFTGNPAGAVPLILEILNDRGITNDIVVAGIERWDTPSSTLQLNGLQESIFPKFDPNQSAIFSNRYKYYYGEAPHSLAAIPYDGIIVIDALVKRGQDGTITLNEIRNTDELIGAYGPFQINPDGTTKRSLAVFKIQDRKVVVVDQAPRTLQNQPSIDGPEDLTIAPIQNLPLN